MDKIKHCGNQSWQENILVVEEEESKSLAPPTAHYHDFHHHRLDHGREPSTARSGSPWPERKPELVYWCRRRVQERCLFEVERLPARRSPMLGHLRTTGVYDTNGEGSVYNR